MTKRRITITLDEQVAEALELTADGNVSATASTLLAEALERRTHQIELLAWLDDLNNEQGLPSEQDYATAEAILDEAAGLAATRGTAPAA